MLDLKTIHTKVLLNWLKGARRGCYYGTENEVPSNWMDSLKTELATRPHIPNKKEGKKLRQEAAKRRR